MFFALKASLIDGHSIGEPDPVMDLRLEWYGHGPAVPKNFKILKEPTIGL